MAIDTLTKTSIRSLRTGCPTCNAEGPFYSAVDQDGNNHLIVKNGHTKAADQGAQVAPSTVHICAENGGGDQDGEGRMGSKIRRIKDDLRAKNPDLSLREAKDIVDRDGDLTGETDEVVDTQTGKQNTERTEDKTDDAAERLRKALQDALGTQPVDMDAVNAAIDAKLAGVQAPTRTIVVKDSETREVTGTTHKQFGDVLAAISAGCNVQMVGGPGVGKTHMSEQVAEALGRDFYVIGFHLQSTASELKGYNDANGNFVPTVVVDWASNPNGGLLLTDELDRSHPGIQAALNYLLSNRFLALPNREVIRLTPNHVILAATNTYGVGPTWEFPAAQKFSAEFKDRFIALTIEIDEDIELAAAMAKGASVEDTQRAVSYVQSVRKNVQREAISGVVVTPRASQNMAALLAQNVSWDNAVSWTLRKGMDADTWRKVA